uniref:Cytochrome P450 family 8 subfamily B member 1 n=1 Tax=Varanus komodoensis TaxID=61221 RepID=A0A8D2LFM5_VARKO
MAFWGIVLGTLLAISVGALYLFGAFRRRRPKEPPLDKGHIPWLGHGLHFRRDNANFLQKMQEKHGDIFTTLIAGQYFTFLMDPLSFGAVVKEARAKLDFISFAKELILKVFHFRPNEDTHKLMQAASTKHLKGNGLEEMTQAMMKGLQRVMLHSLGSAEEQKPWEHDGLFHFCYNMVFRAGYLALFGNEPIQSGKEKETAKQYDLAHSEEVFVEFRKYDQLFPRLAYSMLTYTEKQEVKTLWQFFWNLLSVKHIYQKENISGWVHDQQEGLAEGGMPEYMRDRFMFLLLWAAQGNTGPASFWLFMHLLKNPQAMQEVKREVDRVVKESDQEVKPGGPVLSVTKEMLSKCSVLDSAVEETLRMSAAPLLIRAVMEDMDFLMQDGRVYVLRKGDKIGIFPYLSLHMDPEIHPEPQVFKHDRFLSLDGTRKEFYKNGKKVKYPTMPWGAGISMCPGRCFSRWLFLYMSPNLGTVGAWLMHSLCVRMVPLGT